MQKMRMNWDTDLQHMTRSEFSWMFKMDHLTFLYLLGQLGPALEQDYVQSQKAGRHVSPSLQLGMTLRWFAGGSYLDVAPHYGVDSTTFYDLVNAGCDAIVETFPIVFAMSERTLKQRAKELGQRQWKHMRVFIGIVGCLDGNLLKIKSLSMAEVGMPREYWCCKSFSEEANVDEEGHGGK